MNNKLYIIYIKKTDTYLIMDSKIIWQLNFNYYKKNNKNLKLSNKMNKYLFFLISSSIFGICSINNSFEFYKH